MRALVVTCRDPLRPANHRSACLVRRRKSLRNLAPRTRQPVICQINGQWISRRAWGRRVDDGDSVVFVVLPQGGGGGGSNPLKIILSIAIAIYAPYLGELVNTSLFAAESSMAFAVSSQVIGAAIGVVGSLLVNALIPPPRPTQAQQASSLASPSPTYSLGAQGNSARIGQPIPVIYGRHMVYPDFAAMPYLEYAGNEQYLYQLFCVGQGEYDIEEIRIEDTPISSFSEITYEIVPPGETVTLFPVSVVTSVEVSGQEATTDTALGPFVVTPPEKEANYIAIDVVMPKGLYYANDSGGLSLVGVSWKVEAQKISSTGTALGDWFTVSEETYAAATATAQRLSNKYAVPLGRYQVKLTRTDTKADGSRYGHDLAWAGLRAYLPGNQTYGNVTVIAMRMRATNNLSQQASRKVNLIITRKLPAWDPATGWSQPVPTRSIAWAIADIARAEYGAGLTDTRIDLSALAALDAVLEGRGDTFNAVFDSQGTVMEALAHAARAGRAIPFLQGGIVHVVRDAAETIPVAMFSQRNILRGSLKIDYLMPSEETADAIDVTYFDQDVWGERTVRATLEGGTSKKPATIHLTGVTDRQQAWNEGMYSAACNRYRRRIVSLTTEMEGFIPSPCDLIAVQHDLPKWGQSGEIVAWDGGSCTATLSEPLDWSAGGAHCLAFRSRIGAVCGPYTATAGADAYHVTLSGWSPETDQSPDTGGDRERSHFAFGPANQQYIRCRVVSLRPKSSETVEVIAVTESDYVHEADTGTAPGVSAWQLPSKFTSPVIAGLKASSMPDAPERMIITWQPAAGADHYLIEQSSGDGSWTRVGEVSSASFTAIALYGPQTMLRVAAVGLTRGPWVEVAYGMLASYQWTDDANPMWTTDSTLMWRY